MFKGCHFERPAILLCVRWYLAYWTRRIKLMHKPKAIGKERSYIRPL